MASNGLMLHVLHAVAARKKTPVARKTEREKVVEAPAEVAGIEQFRGAADRELKENAAQIAKALGNGAGQGSVSCAKLLVELATESRQACKGAGRTRRGLSRAEALEAEKQWTGPALGVTAEDWGGSREPEDWDPAELEMGG